MTAQDDEFENVEAEIVGLPVPNADDVARARDPFEIAASEFTEALRRGEPASIEAYCERFPQVAATIRDVFPLLRAMEGWKGFKEKATFDYRALETLPHAQSGGLRLLRELGRGGMGIVYEAEQGAGGKRVAVKVLPFSSSAARRQRFQREAWTAAALWHPHIVPVYSYGVHNDVCYYTMKLIRGVGLDAIIRRLREAPTISFAEEAADRFDSLVPLSADSAGHRPAPKPRRRPPVPRNTPGSLSRDSWTQIARLGAQVADAMSYAHGAGTLHRDIKPANLLLDAEGQVWVTDFGLAEETRDPADEAETEDVRGGTRRYMAPEQSAGSVDARSDIYSLGVTLFELLTRTPAFAESPPGSTPNEPRAESRGDLPWLTSINPAIPRALEAIVLKAAANDPDARYDTAADLRDDLLRFHEGDQVDAKVKGFWSRLFRGKSK